MSDLLNTYKNRRILITGHSGFKGSWLCNILDIAGAKIYGLSLDNEHFNNPLSVSSALPETVVSYNCDIKNYHEFEKIIKKIQPEVVFHLAAQSLVSVSYVEPLNTLSTNVIGTANLLDIIGRTASVQAVVCVTSDKCYENNEWTWGYRENDVLGGHDPYSISKACAELVCKCFQETVFTGKNDIGLATARAGNVIGGGDWSANRIIPDCVRSINEGRKIKLRRPNSTRPWQHVLEPLSGYLLLGKKLLEKPSQYNGSWNFGPTARQCVSVEYLVNKVIQHFGRGAYEVDQKQAIGNEAGLLQLNCDKANMLLSWYPRWGLDTTVIKTVDWYKHVLERRSASCITRDQISEYFDV